MKFKEPEDKEKYLCYRVHVDSDGSLDLYIEGRRTITINTDGELVRWMLPQKSPLKPDQDGKIRVII